MLTDGRDRHPIDGVPSPIDGAELPISLESDGLEGGRARRTRRDRRVALATRHRWLTRAWILAIACGWRISVWMQIHAPRLQQRGRQWWEATEAAATVAGRRIALWAGICWVWLRVQARQRAGQTARLARASAVGVLHLGAAAGAGGRRAAARARRVTLPRPALRPRVRPRQPAASASAPAIAVEGASAPPSGVRERALDAWRAEQARLASERRSRARHWSERDAGALRGLLATRLGVMVRPATGRFDVDGLTFAAIWDERLAAYNLVVLSACQRCGARITSGDILDLADLGHVVDDLSRGQDICDACRIAPIARRHVAEDVLYDERAKAHPWDEDLTAGQARRPAGADAAASTRPNGSALGRQPAPRRASAIPADYGDPPAPGTHLNR